MLNKLFKKEETKILVHENLEGIAEKRQEVTKRAEMLNKIWAIRKWKDQAELVQLGYKCRELAEQMHMERHPSDIRLRDLLAYTSVPFTLDRDLQEFISLLEGRAYCSLHCCKFSEGKWILDEDAFEAFVDSEYRWYISNEKQKAQFEFAKHFAEFLNILDDTETRLFLRDIMNSVERPAAQVTDRDGWPKPQPWEANWRFPFRDLADDPQLPRHVTHDRKGILNDEDKINEIFMKSENPGKVLDQIADQVSGTGQLVDPTKGNNLGDYAFKGLDRGSRN